MGLVTRVSQERCPHPFSTRELLVRSAQKLQTCQNLGLDRVCDHRMNGRQQDMRIFTAPGKAPSHFLPSPLQTKTPLISHIDTWNCRAAWPGLHHPAPRVPLLLSVERVNAIPWHFMLKQTGKRRTFLRSLGVCLACLADCPPWPRVCLPVSVLGVITLLTP